MAPAITVPVPTLDIRALGACADRKAAVLAAFDALGPGESLVVVNDHLPRGLLLHFQEQRPGAFEWSPLAEGPETWRVEITRRKEAGPREVTEALAWDHDRLEALEQEAFDSRADGDFATAAAVYGVFVRGLRRHIGFEEEVLFPEFEARMGLSPEAGPTAVMRFEHRAIEGLLAEIEAGIGNPSADVDRPRAALHQVLSGHNLKEERVVYPGTDRALSAPERDVLVRRIQAYAGADARGRTGSQEVA